MTGTTAGGMPEPEEIDQANWTGNYFNYYTEIEEHFQRARGTGLFLLSPLDWALIESWKASGIPLQSVLKGVDAAFEKWRSRKLKRRAVNSLAYCAQAVMEAAERAPSLRSAGPSSASSPFASDELRNHLKIAAGVLLAQREVPLIEIGNTLESLAADASRYAANLEELEQRLTALEDKMVAVTRTLQSDDDLLVLRQELDRELKPYRGKMTADQLSMLERRYLDTALLERARLPRLSLFYIR